MCSALYYFSFFENDDIISTFDCLESMSDDDDGATFEEVLKRFGYFLLTVAIKSCCRFIEEDNLWVFEEYFCNGESLFLSSR